MTGSSQIEWKMWSEKLFDRNHYYCGNTLERLKSRKPFLHKIKCICVFGGEFGTFGYKTFQGLHRKISIII